MKNDPIFTDQKISDYLDFKSLEGYNLENYILLINQDYFDKIPNIKPNSISDLSMTIYGVDYKLKKNLEVDFILKPK
jgi:hypothetical protein